MTRRKLTDHVAPAYEPTPEEAEGGFRAGIWPFVWNCLEINGTDNIRKSLIYQVNEPQFSLTAPGNHFIA